MNNFKFLNTNACNPDFKMLSVLNKIDTCHEDIIHDACVDYHGIQLATCSSDNVVKIFNIKNGTYSHVADLKGHFGPVWQISWAHPKFGNILASCSYDKRVIVWKENREWSKMYEYKNHEGSVNTVAFGPQEFGLILACGSSDGSISVLTLRPEGKNWEPRKILNAHKLGVNAVSWSPYTSFHTLIRRPSLFSKSLKRFASAGSDCLIKIWVEINNHHWEEIAKLSNHCDWVRDVAWGPSTSVPTAKIASASQDKKVIIWTSKDELQWQPQELPMFEDVVWSVSWSPTGNILAVSEGTNKVTLWKEACTGEWNCVSEVGSVEGGSSSRSSIGVLPQRSSDDC